MFFVRTAILQDALPISVLLAATLRATYTAQYSATTVEDMIATWHLPSMIAKHLSNPNGEYLVADDGAQIGGMAFASVTNKVIFLHQLYVQPDFQRKGIGQMLFAEIENCFMDANILELNVESKNTNAIAFFEAHGLKQPESIANLSSTDSNIFVHKMTKSLKI